MKRQALVFVLAVLTGCTVKDGEYIQKTGARIDYSKIDELKVDVTTIPEAIASVGAPSQRYVASDGTEKLTFKSVRARTSDSKAFGVTYDRKQQTFTELVTLTFVRGVLVSKSEESGRN